MFRQTLRRVRSRLALAIAPGGTQLHHPNDDGPGPAELMLLGAVARGLVDTSTGRALLDISSDLDELAGRRYQLVSRSEDGGWELTFDGSEAVRRWWGPDRAAPFSGGTFCCPRDPSHGEYEVRPGDPYECPSCDLRNAFRRLFPDSRNRGLR